MAGFDISPLTNTVLLRRARDGTATGEASFTVANQTGHTVLARARAVAEGSTDPTWLDPDRAERNFTRDATETFIVMITVPKEAPAGEHLFRLDVASLSLPDEEWGRGSSVRFQVPEIPIPVEPEEEPPGYLETVGGALLGAVVTAVAVLVVSGIAWLLSFVIGSAALVIVIGIGGLGAWFGPVAGAFFVLRFRGFQDPWSTAVPMAILMFVLGFPIAIAFLAIGNAVDIDGIVGAIWAVLTVVAAVSLPALAARAFARWRHTGHL